MAPDWRRRQQKREKREAALTRVLLLIVALLVLLAAAISLGEQTGGLPFDWQDVYRWFDVGTPAPRLPEEAAGAATKVHFVDVGQGDAVLLEQSGSFALIDAGEAEAHNELIAYLHAAGVERLSLVVMTHPHTDHIGGMQAVLEEFPTDKVLLPDFSKGPLPTSSTFERLMEAIRAGNIAAVTARAGDVFAVGAGTLTVLGAGIPADDLNDISLVTMFEAPGIRYLSGGDAEKAVEQALLASGTDVSANLFKAAHHGSSTSNTEAFLSAVKPQAVVISCGAGNSYGHPHTEALEAFASVGAAVYRTDTQGTVAAYVDADGALQVAVTRQEGGA